jgi:hypothetical protein
MLEFGIVMYFICVMVCKMSSSMSSGWLTCRVCCSSAKYDGGD